MGKGPRFTTGLFLLLGNFPFGYGGLALCGAIAAARKSNAWAIAGGACYVISWMMLGLGILLVGPDMYHFVSRNTKIKVRAWRRFRA